MRRRRRLTWSWLTAIVLIVWQAAVILAIAPAAHGAPLAEQPQRVFVDAVVAPHPALAGALPSVSMNDPKTVALDFLRGPGASLVAMANDLNWVPLRSEQLDDVTVVRVAQYKGTVPIWGADLALQVTGTTVRSLSGAFVPSVAADTKPALNLDEAVKIATLALQNNPPRHDDEELAMLAEAFAKPRLDEHELVFFNPALFELGDSATALAYRLVLTAPDESASATVVVDALTGKVWLSFSNYHSGKNRIIRDANGSTSTTGTICYTESGPVGTPHPDCVAAFVNTGLTYDYFFNTFGRDSFDNAGATMIAVVRYGTVANAFWNGYVTAFGPGFATRDVVAHEWSHAVTQYTADLIYNGQSGALNEAFSDVFGAMVDRDDWLMGEDTPIGALRSLANPPAYRQPDRVGNYVCTTSDNGGVHINSGIPNKIAYLMSDGGTFNGRTVTAIGRNATERIFYRALTAYLTSSATFADMYNALLAAAGALYGTSSTQYQSTLNAAQAVELNVLPSCGGTATPDSYEPDNGSATAKPITVNGSAQSHNFHVAGDQDWVTFNAVGGNTYIIQTSGLQSNADTVLALFGNNGTLLLAQNDDYGGTFASRISWLATASGPLHVRVTHFANRGGVNTGYNLTVTSDSLSTTPDAYEPDNTLSTAKPITIGGAAQRHNFHVAGDQDWVRFSATTGSTYVVETLNLGAASDTVLELYDGSGNRLAYNDDYGGTYASRIQWYTPSAANLFVKVRHYSSAAYGAATVYDLRVTLIPSPVGDSYEPDNSLGAAKPITVNGAAQTHTFHIAGDQDWVYFDTVASSASYVIETFNLAAGNDTVLELYNSSGALLAYNDDYSGLASRIGFTASSAQRFFVKVRHYSSSAGHSGLRYDIRVTGVSATTPDPFEPDNTAATARAITPGTLDAPNVTRHNFHVAGDQDWVRITTTAGNFYLFETANLDDRADTVITLFEPNGTTVIAENDDGGGGWASRLTWYAPADGTYYLRVRHYSSGVGGERTGYDLRIGAYGTSATPDAYEPDNTLATAKPISVGVTQQHNFHAAGDQDWVYFDTVSGIEYTITTSHLGSRTDTVLELYNSSGALLASNDDYSGWASRIIWTATANGRFFVKVRQYNSSVYGANTDYRLNLTSAAPDAYEPDNTLATARPITVNGAAQTHTFHVAGDQDWIFFGATAGYSYRIETLNLASCSDTVLELYNSSGALLAYNDDGGGGWASRIDWVAPSSANFYVKVRHYSSSAYGACTAYDVRVTSSGIVGDTYEPDNTLSTAKSITVNGAAQQRNFHIAGDQDWGYFDVNAGHRYVMRTFNLGSCSDTVLELYNSGGVLLAQNDDGGGGLASRIDYTAPANARLYLKVRHYNPSASGACTQYDLEVTRTSLNPDAYEPDDTMAQARSFTVNDAGQDHNFHSATDVDWKVFTAAGGLTYTIYTYNLGAEADTVLELYNSNGTMLAYNDDGGGGWASRIVWTAPSSGTFFVKSRPYGSTGGRPTATYSFRIVTGSTLSQSEPAGHLPVSLITVQNEAVNGDQLRLVGITVDGVPQPGQEFTTLVQAVGRVASYKLVVTPKSDLVELLAIEPLDPAGQSLATGVWMAQSVGAGDLSVTTAWQSDQPATLVRLRWRLRATLAEKQFVLPVQVLATDGNGVFWQSSMQVAVPTVAGSAKIDTVDPVMLTISSTATLSLRVIGLEGELPKAYLVDLNGQNEQQFAAIAYAPGSSDTLIASFDPSFKPGIYKVRLDLSNGSQLFSETVVRLLAPGERVYTVYVPATSR
ncbi:M4 family metallopeptidase [Chloroflexus sp.]|uniref:M4 family metallopeptidase n=1 Tax=Chloroflexus sp. TaxID=1904827 RepID=UPI002ACEC1FE|nr:M4 family metallopeptidase [Chloroflexus sp.]